MPSCRQFDHRGGWLRPVPSRFILGISEFYLDTLSDSEIIPGEGFIQFGAFAAQDETMEPRLVEWKET